jgi:hypothetical protein
MEMRGMDGASLNAVEQSKVERLDASPGEIEAGIARLDSLATLLDSAVRIPGTDVRVGVDVALGLIPVIGDLVSQAMASYLIYEARRLGASRWTIARMIANTGVDTVIGAIPLAGDAFDVYFRANKRNMALLRRDLARHRGGAIIEASSTRIN